MGQRTFYMRGMGRVDAGVTDHYGRIYVIRPGGNLQLIKDLDHPGRYPRK